MPALETRSGNAQNELSCFFLNPSRKKEKGARSLEISARARALSHSEREEARGENGRNLSRTFTCTRSCAFYSREFFFLSSCVRFVLRALGFDDILLSRFQNEGRYFSIFPSGFNEMPNEKEGTRSDERKEVSFFVFWRERFVCCFAQKHTDMNQITFFVKVGGEAFPRFPRAFYYFVQRR